MSEQENSANYQAEEQRPISVQEFSKKIKEKYPDYKDVDDSVLAAKIIEKYPEYKNKVSFIPTQQSESTPGQYTQFQDSLDRANTQPVTPIPAIKPIGQIVNPVSSLTPSGNFAPTPIQSDVAEDFVKGAKSTAKDFVANAGYALDDVSKNIQNNLTGGAVVNDKGEYMYPGEKGYQKPPESAFRKSIDQWNAPDPTIKNNLASKLGSAAVFIVPAVASALTGSAEVAGLSTGLFGLSGLGEGGQEYDKQRAKDNLPENEDDRNTAGYLYALAYTLPMGKYMGSLLPKGGKIVDGIASSMINNPEAKNFASKVIASFAEKEPTKAVQLVKELASGVGHGVLSMEAMQLTKEATNQFLIGEDIKPEDWWNTAKDAAETGAMFGAVTKSAQIGADAFRNVQARTQVKNDYAKSVEQFKDIPNANYTEAVDNIVKNYTDPQDIINNFNQISGEMNITTPDYYKALDYLKNSVQLNSMFKAKAAEVQKGIDEFKDDNGNVTTANIDGQQYYIRNSKDLGQPGRAIFAKNADGEIKAFGSDMVTDYSSQAPEDIHNKSNATDNQEDNQYLQAQQAQQEAADKGIIPDKSVHTPNGIAKVVAIGDDGMVSVMNEKGHIGNYVLADIEPYKTDAEKQAEKAAIDQQKQAEKDAVDKQQADEKLQAEQQKEAEKIQLQQQQKAEQQQAEAAKVEQDKATLRQQHPEIPKDKDGLPDYDAMEPEMFKREYSKEFGEEETNNTLVELQQAAKDKVEKLVTKRLKSTSLNEKANIAREIKTLNEKVQKIDDVLNPKNTEDENTTGEQQDNAGIDNVENTPVAENGTATENKVEQPTEITSVEDVSRSTQLPESPERTPEEQTGGGASINPNINNKTFIHETNADNFDSFDLSKIGSGQGDSWLGKGFYLQEKGSFKIENYGKNKIEVALTPQAKIFKVQDTPNGKYGDTFVEWAVENTEAGKRKAQERIDAGLSLDNLLPRDILRRNPEVVDKLKEQGYDGLYEDGELVVYNPDVLEVKKIQSSPVDQAAEPTKNIKKVPEKNNNSDVNNENVNQMPSETPVNTEGSTESGENNLQESNVDNSKYKPKQVSFTTPSGDEKNGTVIEDLGNRVKVKGEDGFVYRVKKEDTGEPKLLNITAKAAEDLKEKRNALNALNQISSELNRPVEIVNSSEIPKNVQEEERKRIAAGKETTGFYNPEDGKIYIVSDRIHAVSEAKKTFLHEANHKGLRELFANGDPQSIIGRQYTKFNDLMSDVFDSMEPADIDKVAKDYVPDYSGKENLADNDKQMIADEFLSHLSESETIPSKWQSFVDRLVHLVRKTFGLTSNQFTQNDLLNIIKEQRERMTEGQKVNGKGEGNVRMRLQDKMPEVEEVHRDQVKVNGEWYHNSVLKDGDKLKAGDFIPELMKTPFVKVEDRGYYNPAYISDKQWDAINKNLTKQGFAPRPTSDWVKYFTDNVKSRQVYDNHLQAFEKVLGEKEPKAEKTDDQKFITKTKRYVGTTNNFYEAGYLLNDGTMLDFSGRKHGNTYPQGRAEDHREISSADENSDMDMVKFMASGNIRMKGESNGFEVTKEPTPEQYKTLRSYINASQGQRDFQGMLVDYSEPGQYGTTFSMEYGVKTPASRILNDIRDYYQEGTKPVQSEFIRFRLSDKLPETPEFKSWFGSSKITDENGNPKVMYHATNRDFDKFRDDRILFFSDNPEYVEMYAEGSSAKGAHYVGQAEKELEAKTLAGKSIMPVYLKAENPFDTRIPKHKKVFDSEFINKWGNGTPLDQNLGLPDWTDAEDLKEFFDEKGYKYDGLLLAESHGQTTTAVFSPNQVKSSTGNQGTFSESNPDIRFRMIAKNPDFKKEHERYNGKDFEIKGDELRTTVYNTRFDTDNSGEFLGTSINIDRAISDAESNPYDYDYTGASVSISAEHLEIPIKEIIDNTGDDEFKPEDITKYEIDDFLKGKDTYEYTVDDDYYTYAESEADNANTDDLIYDVQKDLGNRFNTKIGKYSSVYVDKNGNITGDQYDENDNENREVSIRIADHTHNPRNGRPDVTIVIANKNATAGKFAGASTDLSFDEDSSSDEIADEIEQYIKDNYSVDNIRFRINKASEEVNTNPTDAQKKAGNYKKGHVRFDGFDISIENPKGSIRRGVDSYGKEWERELPADYGYFRGTKGKDKDHVDVFMGDKPESDKIYVVDQKNPKTGLFDEHKVMLGFDNVTKARQTYEKAFPADWKGLDQITRTTKQGLKDWFENGNTQKPFNDQAVKFRIADKEDKIKVSNIGFYSPTEKALGKIEQDKGTAGQQAIEGYYQLLKENEGYVRPKGEGDKTVQSLPVTSSMKQSVMSEGVPMFRQTPIEPKNKPIEPIEDLNRMGEAASKVDKLKRAATYVPGVTETAESYNKFAESLRNTLSPSSTASGKIAAENMTENMSHMERTMNQSEARLKEATDKFSKMTHEQSTDFIDKLEDPSVPGGRPQGNEDLQRYADALRELQDKVRDEVRDLGTGKLDQFIENYYPRRFKDPKKAEQFLFSGKSKRPYEGSKQWMNQRTVKTYKESIDKGLEPVDWNPITSVLTNVRDMERYVMAHKTLNTLKLEGLVKYVRLGANRPEGFTLIDDKVSTVSRKTDEGMQIVGHYYAQEGAAQVLNNFLSKGLMGNHAYDLYRGLGNTITQLQLGLSAFHLGFTSMDAAVSKFGLGLEYMYNGNLGEAAKHFAMTPIAPITNIIQGNKLNKAWFGDEAATPEMKQIAQFLEQAGGRVQMDKFYSVKAKEQFHNALADHKFIKAGLVFPLKLVELASKPIMEYVVPRQKLGVFMDMARYEMNEHPNATPTERRAALQYAWRSVDNRMGQMVYDNLFWNKTAKDIMMASVRSVGWNLGTFREIGGAPKELLGVTKNALQGKVSDHTHKIAYVVSLVGMTMLSSAIYQYLRTGKAPSEGKDYFFPKTGETEPNGDPSRSSMPTYMKDIYHYTTNPGKTITNKLSPIFSIVNKMENNKDFYGTKITEEDDPIYKKGLDELKFMGKQLIPFGIRNAEKSADKDLPDKILPFFGITPAPYDLNMSEAEKTAYDIQATKLPIGGRTSEQKDHSDLLKDLRKEMRKTGGDDSKALEEKKAGNITQEEYHELRKDYKLTGLERTVKNFSYEETYFIYKKANSKEKNTLKPILMEKLRNKIKSTSTTKVERERARQILRDIK